MAALGMGRGVGSSPPHIDPATSGPPRRAPLVSSVLPGCAVESDQAHLFGRVGVVHADILWTWFLLD